MDLKLRESTTLIGESAELLAQIRAIYGIKPDGKRVSTPKLLSRCMAQTLEIREKTLSVWTNLMAGTTSAMEDLGVEDDILEVIGWCSGLVQRMLSGTVPPAIANQMTDPADDWITERIRKEIMEGFD